jgi:hypothetical protein
MKPLKNGPSRRPDNGYVYILVLALFFLFACVSALLLQTLSNRRRAADRLWEDARLTAATDAGIALLRTREIREQPETARLEAGTVNVSRDKEGYRV